MHLLRTDTYELVYVSGNTPPYAILSHRWENEEITFKTINSEALRDPSLASFSRGLRPSAEKIRGSCAIARQQGFDHVWIDTCCIDKSSSEELRTALNSMFKWYREATVCHVFLNDVTFFEIGEHYMDMFCSDREDRQGKASEWFERGWTLQELLAPRKLEFYDKHWKWMGTRDELAPMVGRVAGISAEYLKDPKDAGSGKARFREASVATKMSWMAGRRTTAVEDIAYSMLGIFNVDLTPRYGEGVKAFTRLQDAIILNWGTFDESLFAWERPQ
ncbi:HET-domain-containing protein, partial [Lentithecium fluviatile CBS 122367]